MKKKAKSPWKAAPEILCRVRNVYVEQRPVSQKTLERIEAGLKKFFGKKMSERQIKTITAVIRNQRGGKKS